MTTRLPDTASYKIETWGFAKGDPDVPMKDVALLMIGSILNMESLKKEV